MRILTWLDRWNKGKRLQAISRVSDEARVIVRGNVYYRGPSVEVEAKVLSSGLMRMWIDIKDENDLGKRLKQWQIDGREDGSISIKEII